MISDAVSNILREPLIKYTQDMCQYYGIEMEKEVASGQMWSAEKKQWYNGLVELPVAGKYGPVILVPKILVRHSLSYQFQSYYSHYLLPEMSRHEKSIGSSLVQTLKDGSERVTKKSLKEKFGKNKNAVVTQTIKHPKALDQYRADRSKQPEQPLQHEDFSALDNSNEIIDWNGMKERLKSIKPGREQASEYEVVTMDIFTALFYPSLCSPHRETNYHDGRKRVDITFNNEANTGFFSWLYKHYPCSVIPIECKNYSKDPSNPEVDQLSGRFSVNRGQVGILAHRGAKNKKSLEMRCKDTATDGRGFIITLDDSEIIELIDKRIESTDNHLDMLERKFKKLIL